MEIQHSEQQAVGWLLSLLIDTRVCTHFKSNERNSYSLFKLKFSKTHIYAIYTRTSNLYSIEYSQEASVCVNISYIFHFHIFRNFPKWFVASIISLSAYCAHSTPNTILIINCQKEPFEFMMFCWLFIDTNQFRHKPAIFHSFLQVIRIPEMRSDGWLVYGIFGMSLKRSTTELKPFRSH